MSWLAAIGNSALAQAPPVEAPEGYRWVKQEAFTDEFDGDALDSTKWHDHNPSWKGRPPGLFVPESVRVANGMLQIRCTTLTPPQEDGKWTIACGAVQSKSKEALFGYYESRIKASSISTSTTFWLAGGKKRVEGGTISLELDFQESIGGAKRFAGFATRMNSNTHINFRPDKKPEADVEEKETKEADPKLDPKAGKRGGNIALATSVSEEFHTYGCWWVDANTMKFYADGEYAFTIEPSTVFDPHPFDAPMFMNLVCETYSWETPPTAEDLADESRNTAYYDYVRSWKLEPVAAAE